MIVDLKHTKNHSPLLRASEALQCEVRRIRQDLVKIGKRKIDHETFLVLLHRCLRIVAHAADALPLVFTAIPATNSLRRKADRIQFSTPAEIARAYSEWQSRLRFLLPNQRPSRLCLPAVQEKGLEDAQSCFEHVIHNLSEFLPDERDLARIAALKVERLTSIELAELEVRVEHIQYHALRLIPVLAALADPDPWRNVKEKP